MARTTSSMLRNSQYARARAAKWRRLFHHRLKWSTKACSSALTDTYGYFYTELHRGRVRAPAEVEAAELTFLRYKTTRRAAAYSSSSKRTPAPASCSGESQVRVAFTDLSKRPGTLVLVAQLARLASASGAEATGHLVGSAASGRVGKARERGGSVSVVCVVPRRGCRCPIHGAIEGDRGLARASH